MIVTSINLTILLLLNRIQLHSRAGLITINSDTTGVLALSTGCTRLQHIAIRPTRQLTDASLVPLFRACASLTQIELGCVRDTSLYSPAGTQLQYTPHLQEV